MSDVVKKSLKDSFLELFEREVSMKVVGQVFGSFNENEPTLVSNNCCTRRFSEGDPVKIITSAQEHVKLKGDFEIVCFIQLAGFVRRMPINNVFAVLHNSSSDDAYSIQSDGSCVALIPLDSIMKIGN